MAENRSLLLIIEDHAPTRERLTSLLVRAGWDVRAASSEAEGLAMLDSEPRCIVLDLMLPDGSGEAILRRVRQAHPATRVVVATGSGDEARLEAVRGLRPEAVVRKPFEMNEMLRACSGP
jgi:DNA-binding response OmpR family regulator